MNKKYKLGMVLGRFQIFHKGHESIIDMALSLCDEVLIFIGSADKKDTFENPFDYEFRKNIIKEVYGDRVIIAPLNDLGVGNVPRWGDYVIESAINICGMPDCIIYGEEDKCRSWYNNYPTLNYVCVDRSKIKICSSDLKKIIIDNDFESYKKFTNPKIIYHYQEIRNKLLKVGRL